MKKLATIVVGMAFAVGATGAFAVEEDLGLFLEGDFIEFGDFDLESFGGGVENITDDPAGTFFTDTYTFTIAQPATLTDISVIRLPLRQNGIDFLLFEEFRTRLFNGGDVTALDNDGQTDDLQLMANTLYTIEISGRAVGVAGGLYSGAIVVSAVPIPAAGLLFFSGIAALGLVRSKRASA